MKSRNSVSGAVESEKRSECQDLYVGLSYKTYSSAGCRDEPDDYTITVTADIIGQIDHVPGKPDAEVFLGKLKFTLIRVTCAMNDGCDLHDIFDVSQEICDLAGDMYRPGFEDFKLPISRKFPEASTWDDILYFEHLELLPFARGQRIGLSAFYRAVTDWESGCGLVVIQPHPLQFPNGVKDIQKCESLDFTDSKKDFTSSKKSLERYYKQIGFEKAGRSKYMFRCPMHRLPELDLPDSISLRQEVIDAHSRPAI